jgi:hypothetical protein
MNLSEVNGSIVLDPNQFPLTPFLLHGSVRVTTTFPAGRLNVWSQHVAGLKLTLLHS